MSERTPWEEREFEERARELLESLQQAAKEASEARARRRWLVTLRTGDGAERHLSITGNPPRELRLPLERPIAAAFLPDAPIEFVQMPERRYELHDLNGLDGTAVYREIVR